MEKKAESAASPANDNAVVFEQLFRDNYSRLHSYACTITKDDMAAEEIVQQVFCKLWEVNDKVNFESFTAGYLYKAVYSRSLNFLKHNKIKKGYSAHVIAQNKEATEDTDGLALKELRGKIDVALNELPAQCRMVFQMHRFEELKYREIAERLGISVNTVENHLCKALRLLRKKLAEYLPVLLMLFINTKR